MTGNLYIVLCSNGFPLENPRHAFEEVVELSDEAASIGVERGYLVPEDAPKGHSVALTKEQQALFGAYREERAHEEAIAKAKADAETHTVAIFPTTATSTHTPEFEEEHP